MISWIRMEQWNVMAKEPMIHNITDWTKLDQPQDVWEETDVSSMERSFGIHKYKEAYWSGGYVGVGRLFDQKKRPVYTNGREHVVVASSRYGMDPWQMLEAVMGDEEYDSYVEELERNGKFLFRVFYDQPLVRLAQEGQNTGDLLSALSFVSSCYLLCKKGLRKGLRYKHQNCPSRVRGRIDAAKNIRENTVKGRSDRFYCKYIDFTEDTVENRILKSALLTCKSMLAGRFSGNAQLHKRIAFCMHAFRRVKSVRIAAGDFHDASASGLYMYYKPVLKQARCIYSQKYHTYGTTGRQAVSRSVYTIPYMVNMESLFEFYARTAVKKVLQGSRYYLAPYSQKVWLQQGITKAEDAEHGTHLISYCIPDLIIYDRHKDGPVCVLDAKYKSYARTARSDSHQLLSYVLLTGVARCGFLFPGETTKLRRMETSASEYLAIRGSGLRYYELLLGNAPASEQNGKEEIFQMLER